MWLVDPPATYEGAHCLLCELDGAIVAARFRDPHGAPVCEAHFIPMVQVCAKLRAHAHEGPEIHAFNRRKGGPGGRAAAAAKRKRREMEVL